MACEYTIRNSGNFLLKSHTCSRNKIFQFTYLHRRKRYTTQHSADILENLIE